MRFFSDGQKVEIRQYAETLIRHRLFEASGDLKKLFLGLIDLKLNYAKPEAYAGAEISEKIFRKDRSSPIGKKYGVMLRNTLAEYYATDGRHDKILIAIPRGTYEPVTEFVKGVIPDLSNNAAFALWNAQTELEKRTLSGFMNAMHCLQQAAKDHPMHPNVRAWEAVTLVSKGLYGFDTKTCMEKAARIIEELKDNGTTPWVSVLCDGMVHFVTQQDATGARRLFEKAAAISHGMSEMHPYHTAFLASQGEFTEAIALMRESIETGRHGTAMARGDLSILLILGGRLEEANRLIDMTLPTLVEGHYLLYVHKAITAEALGRADEAVEWIDRIPVTEAESRIAVGLRMLFSGLAGAPDEEGFRRLVRAHAAGQMPATQVALAALGLGEKDTAVDWLARGALEEHDPICIWLNGLPFLRHLDDCGRFKTLLQRLGLPQLR